MTETIPDVSKHLVSQQQLNGTRRPEVIKRPNYIQVNPFWARISCGRPCVLPVTSLEAPVLIVSIVNDAQFDP